MRKGGGGQHSNLVVTEGLEMSLRSSINLLCASQFQPRASSPGQTPGIWGGKMVKCLALHATFVGKCPPPPHSFYDGQILGPPVQPTHVQKY